MKKRITMLSIESLTKKYSIYNRLSILNENDSMDASLKKIEEISKELGSITEDEYEDKRANGEFELTDKGNHYNMF